MSSRPAMWRRGRLRRSAGVVLIGGLAAAGLVGCGGVRPSGAQTAAFNPQGETTVTCMVHQSHRPTAPYEPGPKADTENLFEVLHYYTANGNDFYCDGKGPSSTDLEWLRLYVSAGADPAHVARSLPPGPGPS